MRTFAPIKDGGIRGNIFLMMVTTTGSAFFYLPYQAKQSGLALTFLLLTFAMTVSYFSSTLLYRGFMLTKGDTYDKVMQSILGIKIGFLSNFMIFLHTFGAVVSSWIFSSEYLFKGLNEVLLRNGVAVPMIIENYFFLLFGILLGTILFTFSLVGKIEFLKKISLVGLFFIIYLIIVFICLLPSYYKHYQNQISIEYFKFNKEIFVTIGLCFYIFLNQYSVIPICNNLERINTQRILKVILRTDLTCYIMYIIFMLVGYFSMPNDVMGTAEEKKWKIFLLRPSLGDKQNVFVLVGIILFGLNLMISTSVKGYFLLLYFNQIIENLKTLFVYNKLQKEKKKTAVLDQLY